MNLESSNKKSYTILAIDIYKKNPMLMTYYILYIIRKNANKLNSKFNTIYKNLQGMKIIIIENLYPKKGIVNRTLVILKIFHSQNHIGFNIITFDAPTL